MFFGMLITVFIMLLQQQEAFGIASRQPCETWGSWTRGGAFGQMSIAKYSTSTNACTLTLKPNSGTYSPGQKFAVTLSSSRAYGYKVVAVGGATLQTSGGGRLVGTDCVNY